MIDRSRTIARVVSGDLCSGCGMCRGLAPSGFELQTIAPGFTRPMQVEAIPPEVERMLSECCPGAAVAPWKPGVTTHPYWGPAEMILVGHATDPAVRHAGSSGGVLTGLALFALASGMAEQVLHVVPDSERPTRNQVRLSTDPADIIAGAGSRYAASSPLAEIAKLLDAGTRTVFIGKPCDVSALRQLARADPRVDAVFPVKLAFFCAGVPSHSGADRIIRQMGLDPAEVVSFRYRGNGWPGPTVAMTGDGRRREMQYADSWGGQLSKELQFRCKICPDAIGGAADLAAADAWYGGESGYPKFEERDGRSLIMARTHLGGKLLRDALAAGRLVAEPLAVGEIERMQPAQARRKRVLAARLLAMRLTGRPVPRMRGAFVFAAMKQSTPLELLRNFAGMLRRILRGEH